LKRFVDDADPDQYFRRLSRKHEQDDDRKVGLGRFLPCPGSWADGIVPHALEICETRRDPHAKVFKKNGGRKTTYKRRHTACRRCGLSEAFWGDGYITPTPVMAFTAEQIKDVLIEIRELKKILTARWIRVTDA